MKRKVIRVDIWDKDKSADSYHIKVTLDYENCVARLKEVYEEALVKEEEI